MSGSQNIILIHGLWLRSPVLWLLGARLAQAGYNIHYFNYSTTRRSFNDAVTRLTKFIQELNCTEINLVGHSLGGILAFSVAKGLPNIRGRIVALGTPYNGTSAGQWLAKSRVGNLMIGEAIEPFNSKFDALELPPNWQCGVIAGTTELGLGQITPGLKSPHDGTVSVEETRLKNAPHTTVRTTHTSMVWSKEVALKTAMFLKEGKF